MILTGACRCRATTYQVSSDTPLAIYACHCQNCQRWSGSAFALHAMLPESALAVNGDTLDYHYEEGGQHAHHRFCPSCHTRLYNSTSAAPGFHILRAGTLDDGTSLRPMAHIWTQHKQAWLDLPPGVPCWPQSPTPESFGQALQAYLAEEQG